MFEANANDDVLRQRQSRKPKEEGRKCSQWSHLITILNLGMLVSIGLLIRVCCQTAGNLLPVTGSRKRGNLEQNKVLELLIAHTYRIVGNFRGV